MIITSDKDLAPFKKNCFGYKRLLLQLLQMVARDKLIIDFVFCRKWKI